MQSSAIISKQTKQMLFFVKKNILLLAFLLLHEIGFGQKTSLTDKKTKPLYGTASFYSKSLEGTPTATGETFHHTEMSAASNFFKLNTWVRITNLHNGKSILVRINDRMSKGMQAIGRVADLTRTAAKELGFLSRGLTKVKVEAVSAY